MKIIYPIDASPAKYPKGTLIQGFGENPKLYAQVNQKGHNGWDIVKAYGAAILAPHDGTIVNLDFQGAGYGNVVYLLSPAENRKHLLSILGHLTEKKLVVEGQQVKAGQVVGQMGNSGFVVSRDITYWGNSNPDKRGTHLHWTTKWLVEVKPGEPSNTSFLGKNYKILNFNNGYSGAFDPGTLLGQSMDNELIKIINIDGTIYFGIGIKDMNALSYFSEAFNKSVNVNPDGTIPSDYSFTTK